MYAHLTVQETLLLASNFYTRSSESKENKLRVVNNVIAELGLTKAANTIIGSASFRGISGGERKRTAIAVQLITDPAVLFLDEPTSGLDSFQAQSVMESMKELAMSGRLVVSVIHQPRSSIFAMFDQLLLLSEGYTMYYGPSGNAVTYFSALGYTNPDLYNPADYFLDILSMDVRSKEREETTRNRINDFSQLWLKKSADDEANGVKFIHFDNEIQPISVERSLTKSIQNFFSLSWRSFTEMKRDKPLIMVKIMGTLMQGFVLALMCPLFLP